MSNYGQEVLSIKIPATAEIVVTATLIAFAMLMATAMISIPATALMVGILRAILFMGGQ